MLKGASAKGWGPECDRAFHSIKEYIASPLSLSQSVDGEELYLYLAALGTTISEASIQLDGDDK